MNQIQRNQTTNYRRTPAPCPCEPMNPHDSMTQVQLWNHINEISFAINDIQLYLDTHPQDSNALAYVHKKILMRKSAKESYARRFGPLTVDCAAEIDNNCWLWITQPWPWEPMLKGGC